MARITPWTEDQLDAIRQLREAGRIQNERPCGCFDVLIEHIGEYIEIIKLIPCDTCKEKLIPMIGEPYGG